MCTGIVGLCSVEIQGTWGTNTGHLASQLAAISTNRIGQIFSWTSNKFDFKSFSNRVNHYYSHIAILHPNRKFWYKYENNFSRLAGDPCFHLVNTKYRWNKDEIISFLHECNQENIEIYSYFRLWYFVLDQFNFIRINTFILIFVYMIIFISRLKL